MPIINHSRQPVSEPEAYTSVRSLVGQEHGATSLTVQEVVMRPGGAGRLHTHPTDIAIMMLEGSIQWDGRSYGNNMVFAHPVDVRASSYRP
jgi:quercetin dioxygenase-like cupin family protein